MITMTKTGTWRDVADVARVTVGMANGKGEPSDAWKRNMLLAEHSPIRKLHYTWVWDSIPYFVSVHMVRHKIGIEHWVKTSRTDRTGVDRNKLPQNNPVTHACEADAQAIIYISRKRLCTQASPETRKAWGEVIEGLQCIEPVLASVCVPECIYRGFCPELKSCGYINTEQGQEALQNYRSTVWNTK
jgi:hypothetical protein